MKRQAASLQLTWSLVVFRQVKLADKIIVTWPSGISLTTVCSWRGLQMVIGDRKQSDVTWRTVTSSTRRREKTWASVEDEQDKMADWVVSTSHSQTCCTSYSHISMPHQHNTGSSSSTTSSFMWKVNRVLETFNWNILYCVYTSSLYFLSITCSVLSALLLTPRPHLCSLLVYLPITFLASSIFANRQMAHPISWKNWQQNTFFLSFISSKTFSIYPLSNRTITRSSAIAE